MKNRVKVVLGGKAATELEYGEIDVGASNDLNRAFKIAARFVDDYCMLDFSSKTRYSCEIAEKTKKSKAGIPDLEPLE